MSRRLRKRFVPRTDRNSTDSGANPKFRSQGNLAIPSLGFTIQPTVTFSAEVCFNGVTRTIYAAPSSLQVSTIPASERPPFPRIYFNKASILRSPHAVLIACMQPEIADCIAEDRELSRTAAEEYLDVLTGHALVVDDCYWLSVLHEHERNERVELAGAIPDLGPISHAIEEMRDQVTTALRNWGCMVTL